MKQHYISAANKFTASPELREKTLAAMQGVKPEKKKAISLKHITLAAAACLVLVLALPAVLSLNALKSAAPMPMEANLKSPEPFMASGGADAQSSGSAFDTAKNNGTAEKQLNEAAPDSTAAVMPRSTEGGKALTAEAAAEYALSGMAYLENADTPGGYEANGLEILNCEALTFESGEAYFKITAKLSSGTDIILIVK